MGPLLPQQGGFCWWRGYSARPYASARCPINTAGLYHRVKVAKDISQTSYSALFNSRHNCIQKGNSFVSLKLSIAIIHVWSLNILENGQRAVVGELLPEELALFLSLGEVNPDNFQAPSRDMNRIKVCSSANSFWLHPRCAAPVIAGGSCCRGLRARSL